MARYIIRASFSQERVTYIAADQSADGMAKVIYQSKDGTSTKTFDALDWLAQLVTHIPSKGEQMIRYYGFYSNKSRGLRKKAGTDDDVPALIESEVSSKEFRKNWARLIQKIYNANPLVCPKCLGSMRIFALIDDSEITRPPRLSSRWRAG
ncbi:MAG: transposase [Thiotrichaceae bacterium]